MLFIAHWLVIIVLGYYLIQLARKDGPKLPVSIAALWLLGYFGFPSLGLEGGLYFISYGAVLCLILIFADLTREKMGHRQSRTNPLSAHLNASDHADDD